MKNTKHLLKGFNGSALLLVTLAGLFSSATNSSAVSGSWNGTSDAIWANTANWSATPVPGVGDTATFNNAGNLNTTITTGSISLSNITFNTANAAAYTLGATPGAGTITFADGTTTAVTMNSTVAAPQIINANLTLGTAIASTTTFTNSSTTTSLTLGGAIAGGTGGTAAAKTLTVNGAGNTTISGAISNGGATNVALRATGPGVLTLSGSNSYTGTTQIGSQGGLTLGNLLLSGSGKIGTGAVTVWEGTLNLGNTTQTINGFTVGGGSPASSATVLIGSGILNLGGDLTFSAANNHAGAVISGSGGGVINLLGNRAFNAGDSNIASDDLIISAIIANGDLTARGILKGADGVLTLTAANTFTGDTSIVASGGTLKLDFAAANAPASNILYNAVAAGALNIGAGTSAVSTLLVQGKSDTTNSQAFGNLTLSAASNFGLNSITVNSGSNGTLNLSLGTITRAVVGAAIAFTGPASGNITTTQTDGRIAAATYTSGSGVTTWAGVTTGTLGAYTGDTLYAGGNIISSGSSNLFINNTTSGNVTQVSGTTTLATLTMLDGTDRTVAVGAGNALLFSGAAGGLQRSGTAGNLTIGTSGSAGSITAGTTASHEFVITNGSTSNLLTINSVITNNAGGSPVLNITGPGRTVFTGSNTYTGATNINAGILEIQNNNALGSVAGGTLIATGATLGLSGTITTAEAITINGNGLGNGGALRNFSGVSTLSGAITPLSFSNRINSDAGTLAITGTFVNGSGRALTFGGSGNTTLAIPISTGAANLTKDGSGTLTLLTTGVVSTSGAVTLNDGTLRYGANDAMGTGIVTVNGGVFDLSTFSDSVGVVTLSAGSIIGSGTLTGAGYTLTNSGTISANLGSNAATLIKSGSGTATLAGTSAYTGATTINSGTLNITGNLTGGTAITLAGPAQGIGGNGSLTQGASSVISGATSILTAGNMALVTSNVLAGNNTYSGVTNIQYGVWRLLHSNALGSTANGTSVSGPAALELAGDISIGAEALTLGSAGGISNGGALRNISGSNSYAGAISLGFGTRINSDAGTLTLTGTLTSTNLALLIGGAGNTAVTNTIALGTGALTKDGSGTLTLSGSNTYSGATAVNAGIIVFQNTSAKASNTVTALATGTIGLGVGGSGYYSSANVTSLFNTNTLTGFFLNAASGVAIDTTNAGGSFEQSTALTAARSLTKLGTGILTLSGSNTYSGATTVSQGTLIVSGSLGASSAATVASNAQVGGNGTINGNLTLSNGARFVFDLDNTPLTVGGTFALSNTFGIASLVQANGTAIDWTMVNDGTYSLVATSFVFNDTNISNFGLSNAATGLGGGKSAYFTNGSLQLVVVPEPSTWMLLSGGLTALMIFRRRRA